MKTLRFSLLPTFIVLPLSVIAKVMPPLAPKAGRPLKAACVGKRPAWVARAGLRDSRQHPDTL